MPPHSLGVCPRVALLLVGGSLGLAAVAGCGRGHVSAFVRWNAPVLALTHLRVIDGTGAPAADDQTIVIEGSRIRTVGPSTAVRLPANTQTVDLSGRTAMPGLVGMHEHLFYQIESPSSGALVYAAQAAFTRLYLAAGVTTIRTAGTADFDGDLRIKRRIDDGVEPGPRIDVTGPYLNAIGSDPSPDEITRLVADAADRGATSFKAYTTLRSSELHAAIEAAHSRGLRITGHLCAVGFHEAIALGIDNVEHGIVFDTDLYSRKQPDQCPNQSDVFGEILSMDMTDDRVHRVIADLVGHGTAVTSTLAVIDSYTGGDADPRVLPVLSSGLQGPYRDAGAAWADPKAAWPRAWARILKKEMEFERQFAAAGGRLMAGVDPTGWGGIVAGFGDQSELELLVAAGFSPEAAIKIATANGAAFLREADIGTISAGRKADIVVVGGNPSVHISDVQNVEVVFKDGVGYDSAALIAASAGTVGEYDVTVLLRWPWNALLAAMLLALVLRIVSRLRARGSTGRFSARVSDQNETASRSYPSRPA